MSTIFMCNETSMTKKGLFLNYGWPMHPGFGVELHKAMILISSFHKQMNDSMINISPIMHSNVTNAN